MGEGCVAQGLHIGAGGDLLPQRVVQYHDFVDPGAAFVPAVATFGTAASLMPATHSAFAVWAQQTHQALRHHA